MSKKNYIILLKNKYLKFERTKPTKKGNYLQEVQLFESKETTCLKDICQWIENDYDHPELKKITDWE